MWLAPIKANLLGGANPLLLASAASDAPARSNNTVTISLPRSERVRALRVWNYSKSVQDTRRGAQRVRIWADGRLLGPRCGTLLRRSPGDDLVDFFQDVDLAWLSEASAMESSAAGGSLSLTSGGRAPGGAERGAAAEAMVWGLWAKDPAAYCKAQAAAYARAGELLRARSATIPLPQDFEVPLVSAKGSHRCILSLGRRNALSCLMHPFTGKKERAVLSDASVHWEEGTRFPLKTATEERMFGDARVIHPETVPVVVPLVPQHFLVPLPDCPSFPRRPAAPVRL